MADLKKQIMNALSAINDPELNIAITDLGLVYEVKVDKDKSARIKMTLTTIGCPLFSVIEQEVKEKLKGLGVKQVHVELTFDPPWSMEKMSPRAKAMLGM